MISVVSALDCIEGVVKSLGAFIRNDWSSDGTANVAHSVQVFFAARLVHPSQVKLLQDLNEFDGKTRRSSMVKVTAKLCRPVQQREWP